MSRVVSPLSVATLIFILSPVLSLQETADPSMPYVMAMIVPTIFYCLLKGCIRKISTNHVMAILLWLFGGVSSVVGPYGVLDVRYIKYFLFVVFYICVTSNSYAQIDLKFITKNYIRVAIGVAILILLSYMFGYPHNESTYYMSRYSVGITGVYKNPNYLTSFINVALFILGYILFFGDISKRKKYLYIAFILLFFIGFYLSGTRASIILGCIVLFSLLLKNLCDSKRFIWGIIPIVVLVVIAMVFRAQIDDLWMNFLGDRSATKDEGRTLAWSIAANQIFDNPIFGCGLFAWDFFGKSGEYLEWLHNIFLELVLNQGFIGAILCYSMITYGCLKVKKCDRFFVSMFVFVSGFPLLFQNGLIAVNFWRFVILTRIVIDYSRFSTYGIVNLINDCNEKS